MVLNGGKFEEDNQLCQDKFKEFSGSFPEEVFSNGFKFDILSRFKVENLEKIQESIFIKANDSRFIRIFKIDDLEIYTDPESRMKFVVDSLPMNFFTRYLAVKYMKDDVCIYSIRPKEENK